MCFCLLLPGLSAFVDFAFVLFVCLAAFLIFLFLRVLGLFGPLVDSWPPSTFATTIAKQLQVLGLRDR